ncbi:polyprenyl diphosphate synthase [Streptomyces sp. NPDC021100]|uniref:polyprenyl diphosphate synthase n=1 Tax=Streptomyces sp. NPDC021100 TaxID=3365114 RepID=UPI0037ABCB24
MEPSGKCISVDRNPHHVSQADTTRPVPSQAPSVPQHIGVILDGNRRWAQAHRVSLEGAYAAGARRVVDLTTWCDSVGIPLVTVWALSQDNLQRAPETVARILDAVSSGLRLIAAGRRWRIHPIGDLDLLPPAQADRLLKLADASADATPGTLNVAVAYDGRADIVAAVRELVRSGDDRSPRRIGEADVARHLSTTGQPDIDLVIRTSGEQRLSGFMPWQTSEAELYFTDTLWPDFDRSAFHQTLRWYAQREQRFGR